MPSARRKQLLLWVKFFAAILFAFFIAENVAPPERFPQGAEYAVKAGETYTEVGRDLAAEHIVSSVFWFKTFVYLFAAGERRVIAGNYAFTGPENALSVAWRLSRGEFDIRPVKVTIPEGLSAAEVADVYAGRLPSFDKTEFLRIVQSRSLEGYLFPDTYFISPDMDEEAIIDLMYTNFEKKTAPLTADFAAFGKPEKDVIIMASILEEEARLTESREIVAGILWKRIAEGIPLAVDSVFKYLLGKTSAELTAADLATSSPYNTYTHLGLPPTPISNPGLDSIEAAIHPIATPYLYFLTDADGNMHYASTLEEHDANKARYLQ